MKNRRQGEYFLEKKNYLIIFFNCHFALAFHVLHKFSSVIEDQLAIPLLDVVFHDDTDYLHVIF